MFASPSRGIIDLFARVEIQVSRSGVVIFQTLGSVGAPKQRQQHSVAQAHCYQALDNLADPLKVVWDCATLQPAQPHKG